MIYILRQHNQHNQLWESGFEHHLIALANFVNTPKTPDNRPIYVSAPHSSGWGEFEAHFSYVLNSPHPEWARHCIYVDKRGERVEMIYCENYNNEHYEYVHQHLNLLNA